MTYEEIGRLLCEKGQSHLLRYYGELSAEERKELLRQIADIDWSVFACNRKEDGGETKPVKGLTLREIDLRRDEFFALGADAVRRGKVAAVLLAGGQGTRLGLSAPKGTFDIGLTRHLYIFELLIGNLKEACLQSGGRVPLFVMTSEKNDSETRAFFELHGFFGYPREDVRFFVQDMAPSTDENGKILMEGKGRLVLSANGNGGWYSSLVRAGLLDEAVKRGVEWFNVFSVDNVLQRIADPVFLGAAISTGSTCAAKYVSKCRPEERVGVLCERGGLPDIVEYYELTEEMANARDENGELLYRQGVTLNYLFRLDRLAEIAAKKIPVHKNKKKVPYFDGEKIVTPTEENAYKYETLILDMVRLMGDCLPFEAEREREFAPVKNATGSDSVETARALLVKNGVKL